MSGVRGLPASSGRTLNRRYLSASSPRRGVQVAHEGSFCIAAWWGGSWADAGAASRTGFDAVDLRCRGDGGGGDATVDIAGEFSGREGDAVGAALCRRQVEGSAVDGFRCGHGFATVQTSSGRERLAGGAVAGEVAPVEKGGEATPGEGGRDVAAVLWPRASGLGLAEYQLEVADRLGLGLTEAHLSDAGRRQHDRSSCAAGGGGSRGAGRAVGCRTGSRLGCGGAALTGKDHRHGDHEREEHGCRYGDQCGPPAPMAATYPVDDPFG